MEMEIFECFMYAWKSASGREKIKSMEGKNVECHECGCIKKRSP